MFEYLGSTALTAIGGVTGRHYQFTASGARVTADRRDFLAAADPDAAAGSLMVLQPKPKAQSPKPVVHRSNRIDQMTGLCDRRPPDRERVRQSVTVRWRGDDRRFAGLATRFRLGGAQPFQCKVEDRSRTASTPPPAAQRRRSATPSATTAWRSSVTSSTWCVRRRCTRPTTWTGSATAGTNASRTTRCR